MRAVSRMVAALAGLPSPDSTRPEGNSGGGVNGGGCC